MTRLELVETDEVKSAGGRPYSPAVRAGDWLIVSGQVPIDGAGNTVGKGDPAAQWRQCLENIRVLVEEAGGSLADIARMDMFVTDMRHYHNHGEIRKDFFKPPYPAQTVVGVTSLAHEDWVIEIEAAAYLGG